MTPAPTLFSRFADTGADPERFLPLEAFADSAVQLRYDADPEPINLPRDLWQKRAEELLAHVGGLAAMKAHDAQLKNHPPKPQPSTPGQSSATAVPTPGSPSCLRPVEPIMRPLSLAQPVRRVWLSALAVCVMGGLAQAAPFSFNPVSFAGFANQTFKNDGRPLFVRNLANCMREGKNKAGYRCFSGELMEDVPAKQGRNFCKLDAIWYVPFSKTVQYRTARCSVSPR